MNRRVSKIAAHAPLRRPRALALWSAMAALVLACAMPADGRTVLLDISDCDQLAAIDASAPRLSWAMTRDSQDNHHTLVMSLTEERAMLMRFTLDDIPPDQRIVHAELVVPVRHASGNEPRFYLWRLLADWGPGVCHDYRFTRDEELAWTRAGARGIASDRAARPTGIVRVTDDKPTEAVINVTEDVELWYDGQGANHGWIFTVEDPGGLVQVESPVWETPEGWTLRVTYEPRNE